MVEGCECMFTEELIELFMCDWRFHCLQNDNNGNMLNSAKRRARNVGPMQSYFIIAKLKWSFMLLWVWFWFWFGAIKWHNYHFAKVKLQIFAVAHWLRFCVLLSFGESNNKCCNQQRNADQLQRNWSAFSVHSRRAETNSVTQAVDFKLMIKHNCTRFLFARRRFAFKMILFLNDNFVSLALAMPCALCRDKIVFSISNVTFFAVSVCR